MSWLLKVAAVALLTVLADVILPSGQINKYVKGLMAVVLLIVLVSPVVALFRQDVDLFDYINLDSVGYETDQAYIDMIDRQQDPLSSMVTSAYPEVVKVETRQDKIVVYVSGSEPQGLRAFVSSLSGREGKDVVIYAT